MFGWVSVAEYTSRMDTEPLGALGMDLVLLAYDGVKICVNVHTGLSHIRFDGSQYTASELDVQT